MKLTTVKLPGDDAYIRIGDVIQAPNRHDVVVMCHPEHVEPIVVLMETDLNDVWLFLDEYIRIGGGFSVKGNVNVFGGEGNSNG